MTSSTTPNSTQSNPQADLATAVDCMLEGTNATGFCTGIWGKYSEEGTGETESIGEDSMYHDADLAEYTCAEGALIYGAIVLRGYNHEFAWSLLHMLGAEYLHAYGASLNGENDRIGHSAANGDPRHGIIGKTKELL